MKKTILFAISIITLGSCSEKPSKNKATDRIADFITVVDNGTTYADTVIMLKDAGGVIISADSLDRLDKKSECPMMQCVIQKTNDRSFFTLNYNAPTSASFPVSMSIFKAVGPGSGVGVYKGYGNNDTATSGTSNQSESMFAENFSGGKKYKVDSSMVNITKVAGTAVEGNFEMWLTNAGESKTVTGTIRWNVGGVL